LPRDAFFARTEQVPTDQAVGRIAAEMLTSYPPGIPAAVPGERLAQPLGDLLSGVQAGMVIPDAAGATIDSVHVMTQ
jgi:arginine/lysine/ornithine decarboxylase